MSKDFKPLHEQAANLLAAQLRDGTSPFQKPWKADEPVFSTPLNASTGKNYSGLNALWLALQEKKDPRWMTVKQASYAKFTVDKGAKATIISFSKTSDIEAVRDFKGDKMTDEN